MANSDRQRAAIEATLESLLQEILPQLNGAWQDWVFDQLAQEGYHDLYNRPDVWLSERPPPQDQQGKQMTIALLNDTKTTRTRSTRRDTCSPTLSHRARPFIVKEKGKWMYSSDKGVVPLYGRNVFLQEMGEWKRSDGTLPLVTR
ncbi:MAG: hypothetical protein M1821_004237 [Bathelium mastoideum]|nr:MAG: hypothetical protein M1821_004237 [Bathelium mastoideum]